MSKQYPAKARRWKSCARWSHSLGIQDDLSTDEHDTKEQAEAVCVRIQREGLGGERCHFPLECWVESFVVAPAPDARSLLEQANSFEKEERKMTTPETPRR